MTSSPHSASPWSLGARISVGRWDLLLLALIALCLLLPGIGARDLWNPDEPRYAEVAREMRANGEWFLPHLNGTVYSQKPPLLFWLINLAATATGGVDEIATRLPSLVAAVGATLLVFALGRRLFGRSTAWLAAIIYLSSAKVSWQARVGQIDMVLGALVALAVYCWVRGWQEDRLAWRLAFFAAAGFATLAKGPVGLLPPLLSIVAFLLWQGERSELRRLPWGRGLAIWLAVVSAWLGPALANGGRVYYEQIVLRQNVTRFADPWHHVHPWYYYLTNALPADALPWLLLLPAVLLAWRREADARFSPGLRLAACWVVVTVAFFSLSPGKRTVYIFQMFPGLALLIAAGLTLAARRPLAYRRWLAWPVALFGAIAAIAPAALPKMLDRRPDLAQFAPLTPLVTGLLLALGGGLMVAAWAYWRGRPRGATTLVAAAFALTTSAGFALLLPHFDPVKSAAPLAGRLRAAAHPDEPYAIWPCFDPAYVFYSGRNAIVLRDEADLERFLDRPSTHGHRVFLLIRRTHLAGLEHALGSAIEVAGDDDLRDGYSLLRVDPAPGAVPSTNDLRAAFGAAPADLQCRRKP